MIKQLFVVFIFLFISINSYTQTNNLRIFAGLNYGGPIPQQLMEDAGGKPIPGLNAGLGYEININQKFSIIPEMYVSFKGADYNSTYTRDTLVKITIMGVPGEVPSYYTAYVKGKMNFYYLDMPVMLAYKAKKTQIIAGPYISQIIAGKDAGQVRVMIGDGGFYDDYYEDFNNNSSIHKTDFGFIIGTSRSFFKHLLLELKLSRSIVPVYKKGFFAKTGNAENKLFNTYFHLSLGYNFSD